MYIDCSSNAFLNLDHQPPTDCLPNLSKLADVSISLTFPGIRRLCRTGHGSPACHGHRCRRQARGDHGAVESTAALGASRGTTQHRRGGCGGRRGRRSWGQEGLRSRGSWLKRWQVRNDAVCAKRCTCLFRMCSEIG